MKVAFVSPELKPFSKIGGLGDVALELPKALKELNIDIKVFTPMHSNQYIQDYNLNKILNIYTYYEGKTEEVNIYKGEYKNLEIFFIDHPIFSLENKVYLTDTYKNGSRYIFFDLIISELIRNLNWNPDIIHLNDWTTALIAAYLKTLFKKDPIISNIKSIYTIHNFGRAYQGIFDAKLFTQTGLSPQFFTPDYLEFYNKLNLTKAGIIFADKITTVSPSYAKEIQTPQFGEGLDGLLKLRQKDISGIVNGIDYEIFNPATDKKIKYNYSKDNIEEKLKNKLHLQKELKLKEDKEVPLIGMVTRITKQKGLDILFQKFNELKELNFQLVLLGKGNKDYEDRLKELEYNNPEKIRIQIAFDDTLARKIYAGADIFLMPSLYEPCGLGQLIALRYATIPFVRETGGLKDTVKEYMTDKKEGNGFLFKSENEFIEKLRYILDLHKNKDIWDNLKINAIQTDVSWNKSAKKYLQLYKDLIDN